MGFNAYHASDKDDPKLPAYLQPQKVVHGGSEDKDKACVLAEEAFLLKAMGSNTVAFVLDDKSNALVYTASGSGAFAEQAKVQVGDKKKRDAAIQAAREALTKAQEAPAQE